MSLSICLITREAEQNIERVLRSVAPLQAEVIVGDTGSRDGTVQAARALGATVLAIDWQDDFAAAQNQTLERASGDWVFWLNPDEEFLSEGTQPLTALLARPEALAYAIRVQEVMRLDEAERAPVMLYPRLFRRRPDLRYVGRVHPHFSPPLDEVARQAGQIIATSDVLVRHHAYLSVLTEAKLRWATRLLKLELRDRPGQLHYLIEYGRNLLRLNDPEGHAVLAEASEQVLAALKAPVAPTPNVASLLEYLLTVSPEQSKSAVPPPLAGELVRRWFPNSPPLLWAMAQRAFEAKAFAEAAAILERLVGLGRTGTYDRSAAFDPTIMGDAAMYNLGNCYLLMGERGRAEECFISLLLSSTHQEQARQGYHRVQAARRGAGA